DHTGGQVERSQTGSTGSIEGHASTSPSPYERIDSEKRVCGAVGVDVGRMLRARDEPGADRAVPL
ncbi:MAG: hypothetical protein Q7K37_09275, partial [Dehalococcoidia bacterium]|nr:hypothetical protein [Dehalococcoidia bacterium]